MNKHFLDKPVLRDFFWFVVLPYNLETFVKDNPVKKDWVIVWTGKDGSETKLELSDKSFLQAKESATAFGWTRPRWWQFYRSEDIFKSY